MTETTKLLQSLDNNHLAAFAVHLADWLIADLNQSEEPVPDFTESRAKSPAAGRRCSGCPHVG